MAQRSYDSIEEARGEFKYGECAAYGVIIALPCPAGTVAM